jgi:hypothetical protein
MQLITLIFFFAGGAFGPVFFVVNLAALIATKIMKVPFSYFLSTLRLNFMKTYRAY